MFEFKIFLNYETSTYSTGAFDMPLDIENLHLF